MSENFSEKRTLYVCCGTGCLANGSMGIYEALKRKLEERNLDIPVKTYIKATGCNGLCEKGPVVKLMPDDISYFKVKAPPPLTISISKSNPLPIIFFPR